MIVMSNRQYPMVKAFLDAGDGYMDEETAQQYDQRPFRSMLIRKWIDYRPGYGFYLTKLGREAWRDYHGTAIWRKNPTLPLTAYFNPTLYQLKARAPRPAPHALRGAA